MDITKAQKVVKIQNQIDEFESLKLKLHCKIKFNNNVGYDFIDIKDLAAISNLNNQNLKNTKGKNLQASIEFFQDQWIKMMDSFIESLKKQLEEL